MFHSPQGADAAAVELAEEGTAAATAMGTESPSSSGRPVAQWVEHPTLDFGSGHDPRAVVLSSGSG